MIADIVAFWLAGSRDSPDRASDVDGFLKARLFGEEPS